MVSRFILRHVANFFSFLLLFAIVAILKLNGDELLKAKDDGAFLGILKHFFTSLDIPIHPNSKNERGKVITVCIYLLLSTEKKKNFYYINLYKIKTTNNGKTIHKL